MTTATASANSQANHLEDPHTVVISLQYILNRRVHG